MTAYSSTLVLTFVAGPSDADAVLAMIRAGFGARPPLDPPASALEETPESVRAALAAHGGLVARLDGDLAGALLFEPDGQRLRLRRVAVRPDAQGRGVARAMAHAAEGVAADRGHTAVGLSARVELPATVRFWRHLGYGEIGRTGPLLTLAKELPVALDLPTAEDTRRLGQSLASVLRAGDLVVLDGELGAGKTTLTQGIGLGLDVRGAVTSPTFVIARRHRAETDRPALVHVDAYRLGGLDELDDLDLDASLEDSVTVVEWGSGVADVLADDRIRVVLTRSGTSDDERRTARIVPLGARWVDTGLAAALGATPTS